MSDSQDQQSYADRRSHQRVPLDAPYFVTVRRNGEETPALLVDCGRGGVQLALSPEHGLVSDWLSDTVDVLGLPQELDEAGTGCEGVVSWVSPERCGVRFTNPLDVSEEEMVRITGSL